MGKINLDALQKAMEKAEKFVGFIKDPSLKAAAFDRVLNIFLNESDSSATSLTSVEKRGGKRKPAPASGQKRWIQDLIDEGFFKTPRSLSEVIEALDERGHHLKSTDVQPYMHIFMKEKQLRRKKEKGKDGKKGWQYSNW